MNGFSNLPGWAKIVASVGLPAVIALYLLHFVTAGLASDLRSHIKEQNRTLEFMAQICRNTAKDIVQGLRCDAIDRGDR